MTLRETIEDLVAETEHMLRGPVRYPRRQLGVLSDKLRAALRSTAPSESGERAPADVRRVGPCQYEVLVPASGDANSSREEGT